VKFKIALYWLFCGLIGKHKVLERNILLNDFSLLIEFVIVVWLSQFIGRNKELISNKGYKDNLSCFIIKIFLIIIIIFSLIFIYSLSYNFSVVIAIKALLVFLGKGEKSKLTIIKFNKASEYSKSIAYEKIIKIFLI